MKFRQIRAAAALAWGAAFTGGAAEAQQRLNILFVFADDWGRYASAYAAVDGVPSPSDVIKTPHVDRIAREGVLFRHAFVSAPSCTPCRSSLFSGRHFFNTGQGAILVGAVWDTSIPTFPLLLRDAGYHIGKSYKVWSPGANPDAPFGGQRYAYEKSGRAPNNFSEETEKLMEKGLDAPAAHERILDQVRGNFDSFLADRKPGQPWLYYFGTTTTHREWVKGSGLKHWGIQPDALKGKLPGVLPDVPEVREDVADYLGECQGVDACIGALLQRVEAAGELERTVIVLSGDHGFPGVPSGKCNLYSHGTAVPLVVRWPGGKPGRVADDFVSLPDLCPTFLDIAGVPHPAGLDSRSILPLLTADAGGQIDPARTAVITGRERHVADAREGNLPYPMRALHTADFLYIRNFAPDRWPMGAPYAAEGPTASLDVQQLEHNTFYAFPDFDASPTKAWLALNRDAPEWRGYYDLAFAKRPAEELYDLRKDRDQRVNVAGEPAYAEAKTRLSEELSARLTAARDPRVGEAPVPFERPPFTDAPPPRPARRAAGAPAAATPAKPNLIFILSDDLAQGDLGCYGQKLIQTPHLDRLASEGTRYTQAYSGTTVCAPSRTSLMTGLHMGHSPIRANREIKPEGQLPLPAETLTVAQVLKTQGYATACVGKWGMGRFDSTGSPLKKGFDHFFGYNCQRHAHNYFPEYLYDDDRRIDLPKGTYAQNRIADDLLRWVREQRDRPFFLFFAATLPHGNFEIDDQGIYKDRPWSPQEKNYAAMVTRLDSDVGRLLALLKELGLDEKTLVLFAGDNGSSFGEDTPLGKRFDQSMGGALRGFKRSMYEGGLRQAALARWPGVVPAGRVSDEPWAFWDFLPTAAELAGAPLPEGFAPDGFSLVPFLKGGPAPKRDYFYWELHEGKPIQAIRFGDWKAVRNGPAAAVELYDLARDAGERNDLAEQQPEVVKRAVRLMRKARVDDPKWHIQ
ncbi:MAG: sulfatase-like hydrolase/transferase, partial [Verrucomicrobiota bacterium]|jgi:arylsulfatase A-like enzyme|nr:sulfatase-like hydrolase/transferase [Verrucomicrobiota bacterium]